MYRRKKAIKDKNLGGVTEVYSAQPHLHKQTFFYRHNDYNDVLKY